MRGEETSAVCWVLVVVKRRSSDPPERPRKSTIFIWNIADVSSFTTLLSYKMPFFVFTNNQDTSYEMPLLPLFAFDQLQTQEEVSSATLPPVLIANTGAY